MDSTYDHIGVLWWVEGDDNLNSTMSLEFRRQGDSLWQPGAPAMRAYPTIRVQDGPLGLNYWATSAMFLKEFTDYDWAHLDIASMALSEKAKGYVPRGGTGFGVRLLVEFLKEYK